MRTTDIQIWYKQAYWSQTNYIYKHGFFYNTQRPNAGYRWFFFFRKKGYIWIFIHLYIYFYCIIFDVLFLNFLKIFNHCDVSSPLYSQNAQGILGTDAQEHKLQ